MSYDIRSYQDHKVDYQDAVEMEREDTLRATSIVRCDDCRKRLEVAERTYYGGNKRFCEACEPVARRTFGRPEEDYD